MCDMEQASEGGETRSSQTRPDVLLKKILLLLLLLLGDTLLGAYVNKYSVMHINCL